MPRRVTVSGVVAELLSMLEAVTADGRITPDEASLISEWLSANSEVQFRGSELLRTLLTNILADGQITPEELKELYKAVERVLPLESRRGAKERRRAVELHEKAKLTAEKEQTRKERLNNKPAARLNFLVAGVAYEQRSLTVTRFVTHGCPVFLRRQPDNAYDPNAIEIVLSNDRVVGYMPREDAAACARLLDGGFLHSAYVKKLWEGREHTIPVIEAQIYRPEANLAGLVSQNQVRKVKAPEVPLKANRRIQSGSVESTQPATLPPKSGGCLSCAVLTAILVFGVGIVANSF